jgi:hypothetical protein
MMAGVSAVRRAMIIAIIHIPMTSRASLLEMQRIIKTRYCVLRIPARARLLSYPSPHADGTSPPLCISQLPPPRDADADADADGIGAISPVSEH